jgi:phosphoserine phosphatase
MTRFLVVFDVDSTLINEEAIEVLAEQAGVRQQVEEITDLAMRGEIDFAESLRRRVSMLGGIAESKLEEVKAALSLTQGAQELIAAIHSKGGVAAAVSGGFSQLLDHVKQNLGLDFVQANQLEISNGALTGNVLDPIVDRAAKATFLRKLQTDLGLTSDMTIAVGDGANDIDMIAAAGLGIAFCAKPALKQHADLIIENRDLSDLIEYLP